MLEAKFILLAMPSNGSRNSGMVYIVLQFKIGRLWFVICCMSLVSGLG